MAFTNPANRQSHRLDYDRLSGPRTAFLASILAVAALWAIAIGVLPHAHVIPTVATVMFALAGAFSVVAWRRRSADEGDVTYWDVAGALTLIGICTSALIGPDHMVRIVVGTESEQ